MVKVNVENGCYLFKLDDLLNSSNLSKSSVFFNVDLSAFPMLNQIDVMVFARLCDYLDCNLTDIVEYIPNNN